MTNNTASKLLEKAKENFQLQQYERAGKYYEMLIEIDASQKEYFWYLGLCCLLQYHESEAQLAWSLGMSDGSDQEIDQWVEDLSEFLDFHANLFRNKANLKAAYLIRLSLININPENLENILYFIDVSIKSETFQIKDLAELKIIEVFNASLPPQKIDLNLGVNVLSAVLKHSPTHPLTFNFSKACTKHLRMSPNLIEILSEHGKYIAQILRAVPLGATFLELCFQIEPDNRNVVYSLATLKRGSGQYEDAIEYARLYHSMCEKTLDKIFANAELIAALMSSGGYWQEATALLDVQKQLLEKIVEYPQEENLNISSIFLAKSLFFFPYINDHPLESRTLQNQIAELVQNAIVKSALKDVPECKNQPNIFEHRSSLRFSHEPKLKIGYISRFLHAHSIGWLARWLFHYHSHEEFEIHIYFVEQSTITSFTKQWFASHATQASCFTGDYLGIAKAIYEDQINILIDLDSLTSDCICSVMALKPAPIQASWLGLDASGIPAIDYFIVDSNVVPENAQDYYSEKLWKLPDTYLAVDGFEIGIPTLRREDLKIPSDAVIYYSVQRGFKRHPELTKLQLTVLKQVPNSYLLIKGLGDDARIQGMLEELAHTVGINVDRLRFLPRDPDELTHRANLQIADIVLDTYPYNGATTTMETLWLGIPLVTRVGQQFAARNSYTMLLNAGIEEGIAWTDEQYIEWGVRLGMDVTLRQHIHGKLMRSRQTAPLWNAKQFTLEMENAYRKMWTIYQGQ